MDDFDRDDFLDAFRSKDLQRWAGWYAEDAEWIEYRHQNPPRNPHVMRGLIIEVADGRVRRQIDVEAWDKQACPGEGGRGTWPGGISEGTMALQPLVLRRSEP